VRTASTIREERESRKRVKRGGRIVETEGPLKTKREGRAQVLRDPQKTKREKGGRRLEKRGGVRPALFLQDSINGKRSFGRRSTGQLQRGERTCERRPDKRKKKGQVALTKKGGSHGKKSVGRKTKS